LGTQSNAQLEVSLLAEWLAKLPQGWQNLTHVNVGAQQLEYQGKPLTLAQQKAFGVWNDWADARVFTGAEVWIVEAKIVGKGGGYGQLLDYVDEYPGSADYQAFSPRPIVPILLCAYALPRTSQLFARYGVRTIIHTPSWALQTLMTKVYGSLPIA
jgi:hypothetical protein